MNSRYLAVLSAGLISSCATVPVVEEVASFTAADIVRKVRCEARDSIEDKVAFYFRDNVVGDPYAEAMYGPLLHDQVSLRSLDLRRLQSGTRGYIDYFMGAGIAYDFTLNIVVENDAELGLLDAITGGQVTLGAKAGLNRSRSHQQTFYLSETFHSLAVETEDDYCDPKEVDRPGYFSEAPNPIYPIVGRIGIKKPLDEFVDLALFSPLEGKEGAPATLASALEFKTKVYGDLTPKIEVLPSVTGASLGLKNSRTDTHKVVLAFSVPSSGRAGAAAAVDEYRKRFEENRIVIQVK